jgi:hypothetical protein
LRCPASASKKAAARDVDVAMRELRKLYLPGARRAVRLALGIAQM